MSEIDLAVVQKYRLPFGARFSFRSERRREMHIHINPSQNQNDDRDPRDFFDYYFFYVPRSRFFLFRRGGRFHFRVIFFFHMRCKVKLIIVFALYHYKKFMPPINIHNSELNQNPIWRDPMSNNYNLTQFLSFSQRQIAMVVNKLQRVDSDLSEARPPTSRYPQCRLQDLDF